jgi:hypothetical protein
MVEKLSKMVLNKILHLQMISKLTKSILQALEFPNFMQNQNLVKGNTFVIIEVKQNYVHEE